MPPGQVAHKAEGASTVPGKTETTYSCDEWGSLTTCTCCVCTFSVVEDPISDFSSADVTSLDWITRRYRRTKYAGLPSCSILFWKQMNWVKQVTRLCSAYLVQRISCGAHIRLTLFYPLARYYNIFYQSLNFRNLHWMWARSLWTVHIVARSSSACVRTHWSPYIPRCVTSSIGAHDTSTSAPVFKNEMKYVWGNLI